MKLIALEQGTYEWLTFRRSHVCASDAPAIMGLSPYKTKQQLMDEKLRYYEQHCNPYMQRGKDLEPVALEKFQEETNLIMFPMVGVHDSIDWMAASFDGVSICRKYIVEIKCPGKKDHALAMQGKVPEKYYPQVQHQICVSDVDFAYYYSFDGENGVTIKVERDNEFIEKMVDMEREFWDTLQSVTLEKAKKADHATSTI